MLGSRKLERIMKESVGGTLARDGDLYVGVLFDLNDY
jgi:hypothetical protein